MESLFNNKKGEKMENFNETKFQKDMFTWDGMYLMYKGEYSNSKYIELPCHPTRLGLPQAEFIARFKYGNYKPWKAWVNFIVKNFTVEEYLKLSTEIHPRGAMEAKGYKGKI
jgi:hypothetical protein